MKGPGVATLKATPSSNWLFVNQWCCSTAPRSRNTIDAYAPPKLNNPVLKNNHAIWNQRELANGRSKKEEPITGLVTLGRQIVGQPSAINKLSRRASSRIN